MQRDGNSNIQNYFTNMEHLRNMFKDFVSAEKLPKRLMVLHGVGGVGKSSLLHMFRLHCENKKIPVALSSGDDAKSIMDIIARWTDDLEKDNIKLKKIRKTLNQYNKINAKVQKKGAGSKFFSKFAESAGGAISGAVVGSFVPGVGTIIGGVAGSVAGGMGADALSDWLRGFLSRTDADLWLDPTERFTTDFLEDIAKIDEDKRIVLLLDTFEKMHVLEEWVCDIAQNINTNVLIVIAGRTLPEWSNLWPGWMMNAQVEELRPMSEEHMRQLIHRYYDMMRGGSPDPEQVDQIIEFTSFLPLEAATIVDLWIEYGIEDFQVVKSEGIANVVDRLMRGVPEELVPLLEAAAIVRWFDRPILRNLLNKKDVDSDFNALRRFPFVKSRQGGFALHDLFRDVINKNLKIQDSEKHNKLHECAAVYFEELLKKIYGKDREQLELERLYHRVCADEVVGIKLFRDIAEELVQYSFKGKLRTFLNDVKMYPLYNENSILWRNYYYSVLLKYEGSVRMDEVEHNLNEIIEKCEGDDYLRAKTLLQLIDILNRDERYSQPDTPTKIESMIQECEKFLPEDDPDQYMLRLRKATNFRKRSYEDIKTALTDVYNFCLEKKNYYGLVLSCQWLKGNYAMHGRWREFLDAEKNLTSLPEIADNKLYLARSFLDWQLARVWMGRYSEVERILKDVFKTHMDLSGDQSEVHRDIFDAIAFQDRADEVIPLIEKELEKEKSNCISYDQHWTLMHLGVIYLRHGDVDSAKKFLSESCRIFRVQGNDYMVHEEEYYLGVCCLYRQEWLEAESCFSGYLEFPFDDWFHYFKCGSLIGLAQIRWHFEKESEVMQLLSDAEDLARQHEYNDHLATSQLIMGHMAWEGKRKDDILRNYKNAMIYALRYNRFLLDEIISGRSQGTYLNPIIPFCLEQGEDGKKILAELCNWWKTELNDVGVARQDTISLIPEGITLLEAEKIAREIEVGNNTKQKSVVEQIEKNL